MAEIIEKIDIKDFPSLSAIDKRDNVLLSRPGALGGAKISFELLLAMVAKDVKPIIKDGSWYIGGLDTGVDAVGKTPIFRTTSVGIEYQYEGDIAWMSLVSYEVLKLKFADLTPEQQELLRGGKGDKGDTGDSQVYYGATPPTDGSKKIAVNPAAQYKPLLANMAIADENGDNISATYAKIITPAGKRSPLTPLFVARGAVFNDKTGFYELNGLVDITESQMITIYNDSNNLMVNGSCNDLFFKSKIRTNFLPIQGSFTGSIAGSFTAVSAQQMFRECRYLEIVIVADASNTLSIRENLYMFYNCNNLRSILGVIDVVGLTHSNYQSFRYAELLESIKVKSLKVSMSMEFQPKLTRESMIYMITNALNTAPITLTLHPTAKARLTEEDIALAASKNITIA